MVSFARLLAARVDSASAQSSVEASSSQQTALSVPSWLNDSAVKPSFLSESDSIFPCTLEHSPPVEPPIQLPAETSPGFVQILKELGPEVTDRSNMASLRSIITQFGPPTEETVAKLLLMMARSLVSPGSDQKDSRSSEIPTVYQIFRLFGSVNDEQSMSVPPQNLQAVSVDSNDWNTDVLIQTLQDVCSAEQVALDWKVVVRCLDCEELPTLLNALSFRMFARACGLSTGKPLLPGISLIGRWDYPASQLAMLTLAIASPGLVDWEDVSPRIDQDVDDSVPPFYYVALVDTLLDLDARTLLQRAVSVCPDTILVALSVSNAKSNPNLRQQLRVSLIVSRLVTFPSSLQTVRRIWSTSRAVIEDGILAMWRSDPSSLSRVLDIVQELDCLSEFVGNRSAMPVDFVLGLAMAAFRRDALNLEKWLTERLEQTGLSFVSSCMMYLAEALSSPGAVVAKSMSLQACAVLFKCLFSAVSMLNGQSGHLEIRSDLTKVHDVFVRLNPRLRDFARNWDEEDKDAIVCAPERTSGSQASAPGPVPPGSASQFAIASPPSIDDSVHYPPDVDEEANSHFRSLYQEQMSVEQAVELLRALRSSPTPREQQVYSCMIHTLFDEYRFLTKYPDKELRITGMLFGALAQFSVLSGSELAVLLNHVLQALATIEAAPASVGRLAKFGICALERCLGRMQEFPAFCRRILSIPRLKEVVPEIMTEVERAFQVSAVGTSPGQPSTLEREISAPWIDQAPTEGFAGLSIDGLPRPLAGSDAASAAMPVPPGESLDVPVRSAQSTAASGPANGGSLERTALAMNDNAAPSLAAQTSAVRPEEGAHSPSSESFSALLPSPKSSAAVTPQKNIMVTAALRPSPSTGEGGFQFASVNMDTLLAAQQKSMEVPNADLQDKIHFIFNNLSVANLDIKERELKGFLEERHVDFLAHYVVVKRASIEPNFHDLYIKFLSRLSVNIPTIFKRVLEKSYDNVRILLNSEKIVSSSSERLLLKSLGSWIGALTLGRSKPLLRKDLNIKELLLDAYSNGRLIAVVPFVSKILIMAKGSKIFKPTNPWLVAALRLLKEIYDVPDLKLNVKFELPLLTKELGIDANSIEKSSLLQGRPAPSRDGNPDFTAFKKHASIPSPVRSPSPVASPQRPRQEVFAAGDAGPVTSPSGQVGPPVMSISGIPAPLTSTAVGSNLMPSDRPLIMNPGAVRATVPGSDTVGDLKTVMASASLSSGSMPATNHPRVASMARAAPVGSNSAGGKGPATVIPGGNPPVAAATVAAQQAAVAAASNAPNEPTIIPNLAQFVTICPSLILFQSSPRLKRLVPLAIDRAVREIIQPVVERSSAIATITTKELVLKDFAQEMDGSKIQRAAKHMVQQLAGSLALVTCKEPLRVSMSQQLKPLLSPACGGDQNLLESTVQVLCSSNLDIGCGIIDRAATEKAARDISDVIASAFNNRRQQLHERQSPGLTSFAFMQDVSRVYEDFGLLTRVPSANSYPSTTAQMHNSGAFATPLPAIRPAHLSTGSIAAFAPNINVASTPFGAAQLAVPAAIDSSLPGSRQTVYQAQAGVAAGTLQESDLLRRVQPTQTTDAYLSAGSSAFGIHFDGMASPAAMAEAMRAAAAQAPDTTSAHPAPIAPAPSSSGEENLSTQQVLELFNTVYPELTSAVAQVVNSSVHSSTKSGELSLADLPPDHEVQRCRLQIAQAVKKSLTADEASMAVAQKIFKGLYEGTSNLHREVHVALLESMRECSRRLSKDLVSWLSFSEDAKKLHRECIIALLRPGSLLHITSYDELVAKTCDNGRNIAALDFAAFLVRRAIVEEPLTTTRELYLTLELLSKVGRRTGAPSLPSAPEGLEALVECCRKAVHRPTSSLTLSGYVGGNLNAASMASGPTASASADGHVTAAAKAAKYIQDAESADPPSSRETVASVLTEWQRVLASGTASRPVPEHVIASFVTQVKSTTLYNDDTRDRFLRIGIDLVCSATVVALKARAGTSKSVSPLVNAPYTPVEAMVCLVSALCRTETSGESASKGIALLNAYLQALVRCIVRGEHGGDTRALFRLFYGIIIELSAGVPPIDATEAAVSIEHDQDGNSSPTSSAQLDGTSLHGVELSSSARDTEDRSESRSGGGLESLVCTANFQVLSAIATSLNSCNPNFAPGFSFAWLQLISNRDVMPRLLAYPSGKGWQLFRQLLVSLLSFLFPHLSCVTGQKRFSDAVRVLYKGTLRVLLVLLHDFPEFLCDYHASLCDVIPPTCIQLRNLVLSAYPRTMRLPDPFMPNLKVDKLPEMAYAPRVLSNLTTALASAGVKVAVDKILSEKSALSSANDVAFASKLLTKENEGDGSPHYNIPAINALVLYLGQYVIARTPKGSQPATTGPSTVLLQALIDNVDVEGRYHLLNAVANQLRYPNSHTHYFSCVLLLIFRDSKNDQVKEQITRVLVERLIANRPHPWGLLITFIELIKNPMYKFWSHDFVRCAPQIERLFENVSRFCSGGNGGTSSNAGSQSSVLSLRA